MASKRGPLSKVEVFYIEENVKAGMDINQIATDLDRPIKSIEKCVTKVQKAIQPKPLTAGDQFARHKGSVVMTQNASTLADETRKRSVKKQSFCVTKIKPE